MATITCPLPESVHSCGQNFTCQTLTCQTFRMSCTTTGHDFNFGSSGTYRGQLNCTADRPSTSVDPMPLDEFWAHVEACDWAADFDSDRCKAILMNRLDRRQAKAFDRRSDTLRGQFEQKFTQWSQETGKDPDLWGDGWSDFLAHVVGLGRTVYEAEHADSELAYKRARMSDFRENFCYSIPDGNDYDQRDGQWFDRFAVRLLADFEDLPVDLMNEQARKDRRAIIDFLNATANGYVDVVVAGVGDDVLEAVARLRQWQHDTVSRFRKVEIHHGVDNIIKDARRRRPNLQPNGDPNDPSDAGALSA